jgi:hypothetical protein
MCSCFVRDDIEYLNCFLWISGILQNVTMDSNSSVVAEQSDNSKPERCVLVIVDCLGVAYRYLDDRPLSV